MNDEEKSAIALFVSTLGMREAMARALVMAGITSLEEVAYVPLNELLAIRGADQSSMLQARERAREHLLL